MAATAAIDTPERSGQVINLPLAAAAVIHAGTLVALDGDGNAIPAANTAGLRVIGRAEEDKDNSAGAAGARTINVKRGVFRFANSATAAVDADDRGKWCYVEDDSTVAETATNKCKAGIVVDVDADGVWIDTTRASLATSAFTALAALTSTNGVAAAASADLAALAAEAEKIGDDARAMHATLTDIITALQAAGILK
jgi:hypothetical protein